MNKQLIVGFLALALLVTGCSSMASKSDMGKDSMSKDSSMKSDTMMKDGVFMKNGKVMETMGGKTTDVMADVMLKDGTKIMMDGTVVMKDGTKGMLKNGDMYTLDGMKSMVDSGM